MAILNGIVTVLLVVSALILIVTILLQPGESNGLGAIAGGAETFFGKGKAKGMDAKLAKITKICAVVFIVLAIVTTIVVSHNGSASKTADLNTVLTETVDAAQDAVEATEEEAPAEEVTEETTEEAAGN